MRLSKYAILRLAQPILYSARWSERDIERASQSYWLMPRFSYAFNKSFVTYLMEMSWLAYANGKAVNRARTIIRNWISDNFIPPTDNTNLFFFCFQHLTSYPRKLGLFLLCVTLKIGSSPDKNKVGPSYCFFSNRNPARYRLYCDSTKAQSESWAPNFHSQSLASAQLSWFAFIQKHVSIPTTRVGFAADVRTRKREGE